MRWCNWMQRNMQIGLRGNNHPARWAPLHRRGILRCKVWVILLSIVGATLSAFNFQKSVTKNRKRIKPDIKTSVKSARSASDAPVLGYLKNIPLPWRGARRAGWLISRLCRAGWFNPLNNLYSSHAARKTIWRCHITLHWKSEQESYVNLAISRRFYYGDSYIINNSKGLTLIGKKSLVIILLIFIAQAVMLS